MFHFTQTTSGLPTASSASVSTAVATTVSVLVPRTHFSSTVDQR